MTVAEQHLRVVSTYRDVWRLFRGLVAWLLIGVAVYVFDRSDPDLQFIARAIREANRKSTV